MNIFNIVKDNFFNLLTSKYKETYLNCILQIFKVYENESILGMDKRLAQTIIMDYLEINGEDFDESDEQDNRNKANFIIRKLEECGWIDIDITNDYQELLNFKDHAITIIQAFLEIRGYDFHEEDGDIPQVEYRGYIYTIYSLLNNKENLDYGLIMENVYKNTKNFIREIRKLDSRLKDYIRNIVDKTEVKDLMNLLVEYKTELVDKSYHRLKTSDNVSKYKSFIVNSLEEFQTNPLIMDAIAANYAQIYQKDYHFALNKVRRNIDEIIDIFKYFEEMMKEIDIKNKTYINSTIGKIVFLLNGDQNISGKLNTILDYLRKEFKRENNHALNKIDKIFMIYQQKHLSNSSIYTPRGNYKHLTQQILDDSIKAPLLDHNFLKQFENEYTEEKITLFLKSFANEVKASEILDYHAKENDIIRLLFILVFANNNDHYHIEALDEDINHEKYAIKDFKIIRSDE